MRNRQWLVLGHLKRKERQCNWKISRDEKRISILQIMKLHDLFGQLLREVQRIKSEGDYTAGFVENYVWKWIKDACGSIERNKNFHLIAVL
jgi:dipeptidyl-peptidase-3